MTYCGRFAPSPTGALHEGSLFTALASYVEAKRHQGRWLVRMEDIDPPREQKGAADAILQTLERFGFEWDGAVRYQSQRTEAYEKALMVLKEKGFLYPCSCSRKKIAAHARWGKEGWIYPGTCYPFQPLTPTEPVAWRCRVPADLQKTHGDFVVKRADGLYAYHLAGVVDDIDQGVTHIVRGMDLYSAMPQHLVLYEAFDEKPPHYQHVPLIVNEAGEKLSKQTRAPSIAEKPPVPLLSTLWLKLGYPCFDSEMDRLPLNMWWEASLKSIM